MNAFPLPFDKAMINRDFTRLFTLAASTSNETFAYVLGEIAREAEAEPGPLFLRSQEAGLWDTFLNCLFDESVPRYRNIDMQILGIIYHVHKPLNDYSKVNAEAANRLKTKIMATFAIFLKHHMETDLILITQCFNEFRIYMELPFPKDCLGLLRDGTVKVKTEDQESFCHLLNIINRIVEESSSEEEYNINCQVIRKGLEVFSGASPRTAPLFVPFFLADHFTFGCESGVFKSNADLAQRSMEVYLGVIQGEYRSFQSIHVSTVKDLELCWFAIDKISYFNSLEVLSNRFSIAKYPDGCEAITWLARRTMNLSHNKRSAHIANIETVKLDYLEKVVQLAVTSCRNDPDAATKFISTYLAQVVIDISLELRFDSFIYELLGYLFLSDTNGLLRCYVREIMKSMVRTADEYLSFSDLLSKLNIDSFIVLLSILAHYSPNSVVSDWMDADFALYRMLAHAFRFPDARIYVVHTLGNVCWEEQSMLAMIHNRECLHFCIGLVLAGLPPCDDVASCMEYQVGYLQVLHHLQKYDGLKKSFDHFSVVAKVTTAMYGAVCQAGVGQHQEKAKDVMRLGLCVMIKYCKRNKADVFKGSNVHEILLNGLMTFLDDDQIVELDLWVMYLMCRDNREELRKYSHDDVAKVMQVMRSVHKKWNEDPKVGKRIRAFGKLLYEVGGLFIMV